MTAARSFRWERTPIVGQVICEEETDALEQKSKAQIMNGIRV
jgi:hypothetical protein